MRRATRSAKCSRQRSSRLCRPSPEEALALLRRLTKKGDIPSINAVVDICNLVSIRYALPVAAFDLAAITGGVTVSE